MSGLLGLLGRNIVRINLFNKIGIVFETNAIDNSKPANKKYFESIGLSGVGFPLTIELRNCEIGEQFTDSGRCVSCPPGESYLIDV